MPPSVSVCIPTHGEATHLRVAIASAAKQTRLPVEIVISDDSRSRSVLNCVEEMKEVVHVPLRLVHCDTGKGLAHNVNCCFDNAVCEWLCLLHDDDFLAENAVEVLVSSIQQDPSIVAAFGKQVVVDAAGVELAQQSTLCNPLHLRIGETRIIKDTVLAGIFQMFPNDGYLVKSELAREVRHDPKWGAASEVDFGIRLGRRGTFAYVDAFISSYRLSVNSITRGKGKKTDDCCFMLMRLLEAAVRDGMVTEAEMATRMADKVRSAIIQATNIGELWEAWRWLLSRHHRRYVFSLGGARRAAVVLAASAKLAFRTCGNALTLK